jgi:hypothetical protein
MGARIRHKISKHIPSAFQGQLTFSAPAGLALSAPHPGERLVMRGLFFTLAALACAYVYFVAVSVLHIMARTESETESAKLASSVGLLEREYFALSEAVNIESGSRVGLAPVSDIEYVYRPGAVGVADASPNEI